MKRPSFADGLNKLGKMSGRVAVPADAVPAGAIVPPAVTVGAEPGGPPPSRQGKVAISGYFDPAVRKKLAILAITHDKSQQALLAEALNDLLEKYGEGRIASA